MSSRVLAAACLLSLVAGCSLPESEFKPGGDTGAADTNDATVDTAAAETSTDAKPDSALDTKSDGDTAVPDTFVPDADDGGVDVTTTDGDADDGASDADDGGEDAGPDAPVLGCTAAGPPNMYCIPKATLSLGASNETACSGGCASDKPETPNVTVSMFHLDEHEVTVGRFRSWWNAPSRYWPATNAPFFSAGGKEYKWRSTWPTSPNEPAIAVGCTWKGAGDGTNDLLPLNCVDWYTALGFCMSEGKRLPTEAEFELEASAGEGRLFPWSAAATEANAFTDTDVPCARAIGRSACGTPLTASPSSTVWGRSKHGVWNLAGSLSEWMLDGYSATWSFVAPITDPLTDPTTTTSRIVRGGSYLSPAKDLRAAARPASSSAPTLEDAQIGFRCAKR